MVPTWRVKGAQNAHSRVTIYWETRLRQEAAILPSFLSDPHPLLWTPGLNSRKVSKSLVQLRIK